MTISALMPYILVVGGYLLRHYEVGSKLAAILGGGSSPSNPAAPAVPTPPAPPPAPPAPILGNHPVLSDAVTAAIRQAVADITGGHLQGLRAEIMAIAKAAADAAVQSVQQQGPAIVPFPQNTTKH